MNAYGYALVGLSALVAAMVAALVFALLRFMTAARAAKRQLREGTVETALLSSALQDALSALKAREQAMSDRAVASEQLSAQVFDSLTAGLLVVDASGRVTIANPAACRMLAVEREPAGMDYRELLGSSPLADIVSEGLSSGQAIVRRAVHAPDRTWHLGVTVSPLGDPSSTRGAICLFSDLTAVVELEQQLQMKEALARLGEMTAGIAHEFRNGLATIHGYSRLIDPRALPERYQTYIEGIRQETDTLGRVVTNFLNFARPEQIAMSPVDLDSVARRAAEELKVELPAEASVAVAGSLGSIQGDEVLLRQVFGNLIRNAAEACASARKAPAISVSGHVDRSSRQTVVSVDDNGPGIPPGDRMRIFQPFFTTRSRGSGLGLAIVQKIVLLHNGKVAVGSSSSGGAQIQLTFPLAEA
ncbi:MAG TPA: ATP-binding protein [Vicinamibacterales bacterium]|nr:ATP-binding protein [Vicinamibacterales bacterium]